MGSNQVGRSRHGYSCDYFSPTGNPKIALETRLSGQYAPPPDIPALSAYRPAGIELLEKAIMQPAGAWVKRGFYASASAEARSGWTIQALRPNGSSGRRS